MTSTYRFRPDHRVPLKTYLGFKARDIVKTVRDIGVKPMAARKMAVFVVGCGHAGTTLLASRLGRHSQVFLFPDESSAFLPGWGLRASRRFWKDCEGKADAYGQSHVLEKTPKHVQCVSRIRALLPEALILGIHRNPLDNCASLKNRFGDLGLAISRWNLDNAALADAAARKALVPVSFEDLTRNPVPVLGGILGQMGLAWEPGILDGAQSAYERKNERNANQQIRFAQVSAAVKDITGEAAAGLSSADRRTILQRTARIAARLGYAGATFPENSNGAVP